MAAATLITLRETLEASLVVGIVLTYLRLTENRRHAPFVWLGVAAGIAASIALAFIFQQIFGGFTGRAEELYEGITMLVAAGLMTWMILWMLQQRSGIRKNVEQEVQGHLDRGHPLGIFFLTFVSTAREGIETVIFLEASYLQAGGARQLLGGLLGIVLAITISVVLFKGFAKFPLRKFFSVTSVLLILFAAGLVVHGVHELIEAGVLPSLGEHIWDTSSVLSEEGTVGAFMKGLFGYNADPALLEVLAYALYISGISFLWQRRKEVV